MSKAYDSRLKSSVFLRSVRIYFEPVVSFFQTKYADDVQHEEQPREDTPQSRKQDSFSATAGVALEGVNLQSDGQPSTPVVPQEKNGRLESPEGRVELELAAIWREILGVDSVARQDNFFDMGGDSVLLIRLCSKVRDQFQIDLSLGAFFNAGRFSQMASLISYEQTISSSRVRSEVRQEAE